MEIMANGHIAHLVFGAAPDLIAFDFPFIDPGNGRNPEELLSAGQARSNSSTTVRMCSVLYFRPFKKICGCFHKRTDASIDAWGLVPPGAPCRAYRAGSIPGQR